MERPECAELDVIFSTVEEIRSAEESLKTLKARVATEAQALAGVSNKQARMAAAIYAYWFAPEVNASDISLGATGQLHPSKLLKTVGPVSVGVPCDRCNEDLPIHSRAEMKAILDRLRHGPLWPEGYRVICAACEEAVHEQRRLDHAAQERERQRRRRQLATMPYAEYLTTPDWREQRDSHLWLLVRETGALACETCNSGKDRGVYHKTTEGLGGRDDLVLLCPTCRDALLNAGRLAGEPGAGNRLLKADADQIVANHNDHLWP